MQPQTIEMQKNLRRRQVAREQVDILQFLHHLLRQAEHPRQEERRALHRPAQEQAVQPAVDTQAEQPDLTVKPPAQAHQAVDIQAEARQEAVAEEPQQADRPLTQEQEAIPRVVQAQAAAHQVARTVR